MAYTNPKIPTVNIEEQDPTTGLISEGTVIGTPPGGATYAGLFSLECELTDTEGGGTYSNTGTVAVPAWTLFGTLGALAENKIFIGSAANIATAQTMSGDATILANGAITIADDAITTAKILDDAVTGDKIAAGAVSGAILSTGKGYFVVNVSTNSTTPVDVFGIAGVPTDTLVTNVKITSKDTTASNIIVKTEGSTIATIAKGTAASVVLGATTIANGAIASGDSLTVESSGAGEAFVEITFTVA
jgi:hypothetical protein